MIAGTCKIYLVVKLSSRIVQISAKCLFYMMEYQLNVHYMLVAVICTWVQRHVKTMLILYVCMYVYIYI